MAKTKSKIKSHILIVEDEMILYKTMSIFFIKKGYSVAKYAKSYSDAMKRIKEKAPDVALLDIEIKGSLNGIRVGEKLNEILDIPLLYISNLTDEAIIEEAKKTNPNTYLFKTKTTNMEQLAVLVDFALTQSAKEDKGINIKLNNNLPKVIKQKKLMQEETRVWFKDIEYIISNFDDNSKDYLLYHSSDEKDYYRRSNIKEMEKLVENCPNYEKINRSSLVNLRYFKSFIQPNIVVIGSKRLTVSRKNKRRFIERIKHL